VSAVSVVLPPFKEIGESVVVVSLASLAGVVNDDEAGASCETRSTLVTAANDGESNDVEYAGDERVRDDCGSSSSDGFTSDLSFWILLLGLFSAVISPPLLSFSLVLNDDETDCNGALFLSPPFATAPVVDEVTALLLSEDETTSPIGGTKVTTPSSETMGEAVKSGVLLIIIDLDAVNSICCGCCCWA
jgi:hypothetical protein